MRSIVWITAGLLVLSAQVESRATTVPQTAERLGTGVVVEAVAAGSAAARAGMRAGDVVSAWSSPTGDTRAFPIATVFDLAEVEVERAPRGAVILRGSRDGIPAEWRIDPGIFGLAVRATLPPAILSLYKSGQSLIRERKVNEGVEQWRNAAAEAARAGHSPTSAWLLSRAGTALSDVKMWDAADATFEEARRHTEPLRLQFAMGYLHRQHGHSYQSRNDWTRATEQYERALAFDQQLSGESLSVAYDHHLIGMVAYLRGDNNTAESRVAPSLALRERLAPESVPLADSLQDMSAILSARKDLNGVQSSLKRALAILERIAPGSARIANILHAMGILSHDRGDLVRAEELYRRGLAIREAVEPLSLPVARSLNSLALAARDRGDLDEAERLHRRSLAIQEQVAPEHPDVAMSAGNLGIVLRRRGDLRGAEQLQRRALEINQRLAPGSLDVAGTLHNLANILNDRGNQMEAEELNRQALAIREKQAPGSMLVALSLNNIGNIAMLRHDIEAAKDYYDRSLKIKESVAPKSITTVITLNNLGRLATLDGNLTTAEKHYRRALAILDETAPASIERLTTLHLLAAVARERKDLASARAYGLQSVELAEKAGTNSLATADSLQLLGQVMLDSNDLAGAEKYARRALQLAEGLAPGSIMHAEALHGLGLIQRRSKRPELALETFLRAMDTFEQQAVTMGGAQDVRSAFGTKGAQHYEAAIDLAVTLGRHTEAFAIQERFRARLLLNLMAERDLVFDADVPADLARERKLADAEYDRVLGGLSSLGGNSKAETDRLVGRLRELRDAREQLTQRIRQQSPRLATLQYPQPLDLAAARGSLDPGTVLLSYWIGESRSLLFVVEPPDSKSTSSGLTVLTLPVGETALRDLVRSYRTEIQSVSGASQAARAVGGVTGPSPSAKSGKAQQLYQLLVKPAERLISKADRVLIVPDGPLHVLPFAALKPSGGAAAAARYLIEWKPVHVIVSATVYGQTRQSRDRSSDVAGGLVAFGDPVFSSSGQEPERRAAFNLSPLPATRAEVQAIAKVFGDNATVYLGSEATEERAKSIGRQVRYVHFASHAFVDERLPLNSALVFTMPDKPAAGQDNGLLQVWEILEQIRLDTDLVTLSACETALGKELGGEGLIGLTRAFQFAGARSIVASLWSVADESTSELMARFYRYLAAGKSKDQALRAAQLDAIRGPSRFAHPFHWAAFQLFGSWQ